MIFHALDKTNKERRHAAQELGTNAGSSWNKLNEYPEKMGIQ